MGEILADAIKSLHEQIAFHKRMAREIHESATEKPYQRPSSGENAAIRDHTAVAEVQRAIELLSPP